MPPEAQCGVLNALHGKGGGLQQPTGTTNNPCTMARNGNISLLHSGSIVQVCFVLSSIAYAIRRANNPGEHPR